MEESAGRRLRAAMAQEKPLQMVGTVNAYVAMMAKRIGFRAIYLSGAGIANASYGLPDLGLTTLDNILEDALRITSAVDLPLLVDIDTGWGDPLMIERAIKALSRAGVAGVHIEDQVPRKLCGHLPGKQLVSAEEMVERIQAALSAKTDPEFIVMARVDALSVEGFEAAVERGIAYRDAGADMLFPEAFNRLEQYKQFKQAVEIPVLANMTEFGQTPLFNTRELASANVDIALYPLSVTRAMNLAARKTLQGLRKEGGQSHLIDQMQTREELYDFLNYSTHDRTS